MLTTLLSRWSTLKVATSEDGNFGEFITSSALEKLKQKNYYLLWMVPSYITYLC